MAYHVPFHMREDSARPRPPVFIGFEVPAKPKRRFSWIGFGGFMLCVLSCGMLAPITLIMSLIGLRRGPGFFSVSGAVLSSLALVGMAMSIVGGVAEDHHRYVRHQNIIHQQKVNKQVEQTGSMMVEAEKTFRQYKTQHDGMMPSPMQGSMMAVEFTDAWEQELRYEPQSESVLLRSAGADKQFETKDDLVRSIKGTAIDDHKIEVEVKAEPKSQQPKSKADFYPPLED